MYPNCPIHHVSHLQTEIAFSTAEAEYIAFSRSLRQVIPLMKLLEEIDRRSPLPIDTPNFVCKVHKDNQSCIVMATTQKLTSRTKHIVLKYHHFRSFVFPGKVKVTYCRTTEQKADLLTKPLPYVLFIKLQYMVCGW